MNDPVIQVIFCSGLWWQLHQLSGLLYELLEEFSLAQEEIVFTRVKVFQKRGLYHDQVPESICNALSDFFNYFCEEHGVQLSHLL